ncbi:MAG TPA: maleylpyruvate isomerase family mycothiol-dependent enzyme [Pseudonocardiaceae bacterium]|jgi:maleylpyruvate isomerase|nr:maleylpyruvate isomerase family mycothiol-dependent enzyme [Pseudonocardiaceae bacterium]
MTTPVPSPNATRSSTAVPAPRAEQSEIRQSEIHDNGTSQPDQQALQHALAGLTAVRRAQARVDEIVSALDEGTAHGPSLLPGWTRRHVISHLARNADGLVNLLIWARTGIEHPMYPSAADRDADIEEGSRRLLQIIQEDLGAASTRFFTAADKLPATAWSNTVSHRTANALPAAVIPWLRLTELLVHTVDLDLGVTLDETVTLAGETIGTVLTSVADKYAGRADVPSVTLEITMPTGPSLTITLGNPDDATAHLTGSAAAALGWLTGRDNGSGLSGEVPALPAWL